MMQIGKLDTFVRGGPAAMPDEMLQGEDPGQFDSLLNALVIMPTAEAAADGSPVPSESGWPGFANESQSAERPWRVNPDDIPVDLPLEYEPQRIYSEDPPNETVDTLPAERPPYSEFSVDQSDMEELEPFNTPAPNRNSRRQSSVTTTELSAPIDFDDPNSGSKKGRGGVETPPIIMIPNTPAGTKSVWQNGLQGRSFNEVLTAQNPPSKESQTVALETDASPTDAQLSQIDGETASGETKSDTGSGHQHSIAGKEIRIEKTSVSDAIFERFAVDAENAIREADFDVPVEADAVIEQIEKPILEVADANLEEGEPLLLKFRLKPAELGTVEIRLEKNAAGKLNIEIQAESEIASHVLNDSFEQLRESLKDSGWQVDELNIFNRNSEDQYERSTNRDSETEKPVENSTDANDSKDDSLGSSELQDDDDERLVSIRA